MLVVGIDYIIPKGCFVVPFLSAVHLDENVYNGALNFNPWRWMDPENQVGFMFGFVVYVHLLSNSHK